MEDFSINSALKTTYEGPAQKQPPVYVHPFAKDSIASASISESKKRHTLEEQTENENSTGWGSYLKERFKSTVNWLYSFVYTPEVTIESSKESGKVESIAKAQSNRYAKAREQFVEEMMKLHSQIATDDEFKELLKDGNPQSRETLLMKLFIQGIKNQIVQREDEGLLATVKIQGYQERTANLRKTENQIKDRLEALNQRQYVASLLETASMAAAGAVAVATIAVAGTAVATGAGVFLTTSQIVQGVFAYSTLKTGAVLGVAQSATTFFSGYTKAKTNEEIQESTLVDAQKDLAKEGMNIEADLLKKGFQDTIQMYAMLREQAEQQKDASSSMLR